MEYSQMILLRNYKSRNNKFFPEGGSLNDIYRSQEIEKYKF